MQKLDLGSVSIGIVAGLVLALFIYPSFYSRGVMPMMGNRFGIGMMNGTSGMGNIERHFIEQMIPHHQDAIDMAKLALEKGEHQDIKTLAQNIITAQEKENAMMREWYQDWFGSSVPSVGTGMQGMPARTTGVVQSDGGATSGLDDLTSAKPFDKEFIEQMIPHHQMAIMMAQMLEVSAERNEMKQLASDIIEAQQKEIDQMRQWHRSWYGE